MARVIFLFNSLMATVISLLTVYYNGEDFSEMNQSETSSFGQAVSEEKILKKSVKQKQELPVVAMFVNRSGQNDQSLERTFHGCFQPSFSSFGWDVSEEKNKMWKVIGRQKTDAKWWQKLTLPLARWAKNLKKCFIFHSPLVIISVNEGYSLYSEFGREG